MRLTFAVTPAPFAMGIINAIQAPNILAAFPYAAAIPALEYKPEYLITDSGAFTAWNIGKEVDIDAYATWALSVQKNFPRVLSVNLDVIPGEKGRNSTASERKAGMKQSLKNADYLRERGLNVMEVFHQDEPKEFLDELLARLPEDGVLGISPRNDVSMPSKLKWQKTLLAHLLTKYPITNLPRTHGLAVTSSNMLQNFPYYSADSSSWLTPARFGSVVNDWGKMTKDHNPNNLKIGRKESAAFIDNGLRVSVMNQMRLGDSMTMLWATRGVVWKD